MVIKSFAPLVFRHAPIMDYVGINITFSMESTKRCLLLCLQDKEDDLKVGVKSTALRFGDSTKEWITGFGILCISSLGLSGYNAEIGISIFLYFQFLFALFFFQLRLLELQINVLFLSALLPRPNCQPWNRLAILWIFGGCIWTISLADMDS